MIRTKATKRQNTVCLETLLWILQSLGSSLRPAAYQQDGDITLIALHMTKDNITFSLQIY